MKALPAIALAALGYAGSRRTILTWGATEWEVGEPLPGDALLPDPDGESTRAIGIAAPGVRHLAMARPDGTVAARGRLHL